jgi:heme-degrading monooxygenase HmoA
VILEIADIRIQPGRQADFDEAIQRGVNSVIAQDPGYLAHSIHKGVESPERYVLQIWWTSIAAHNEGFRQSPAFAQWRGIVGPFFAAPPVVEHFELLDASRADTAP